MSAAQRLSPIEKFLGREAIERGTGVFALLGLTPEACSDERVIASLEWQLDRVSQHPEGDTPEADEVRLALHVAAAQLLDRNVRQHVMRQLQQEPAPGAPSPGVATPIRAPAAGLAPAGTPSPTRSGGMDAPRAAPAPSVGLEREALMTLALYGGWNKRSLARLAGLAHARGLPPGAVAQSLRNLATRKRCPVATGAPGVAAAARAIPRELPGQWQGPSASGGSPPPASPPAHDEPEHDPGQRLLRNIVLGGAGVMITIIATLALIAVLTPGDEPGAGAGPGGPPLVEQGAGATGPRDPAPGANKDAVSSNDRSPKSRPPSTRPAAGPKDPGPKNLVDPQAVVRALRDAAEAVAKGPDEAAAKFELAVRALSSRWARFDPAQRRAADTAVIDFVYRTRGWPEASARALDAISAGAAALVTSPDSAGPAVGADGVWSGVWSVGLLTRLSRERELPTDISARVERALTTAIGEDRPRLEASFEAGALAVLRRMPVRLLQGDAADVGPQDKPLAAWVEAVAAVCGADLDLRERVLIDGLEQVFVQAPEPTADRRVFAAIQELALQIKWRKGGPARPRLLDWFKDPRITTADLQVLTGALAGQSSAEGVDPMMVLSSGAGSGDRQKLRSAYAKAWGLAEAASRDKLAEEWVKKARTLFYADLGGDHPLDDLAAAVTMSELSEAATRLWRGEADAARKLIDDAGDAAERGKQVTPGRARTLAGTASDADGQWTVRFLSAGQNIPVRMERLAEIENSGVALGPVDAEVLAEQSCFATPAEVRRAAQRVVEKYADEPVMINAMLEVLPKSPRYTSIGETFARVARKQLPRITDGEWELQTRRALVERLLEMIGTGNDQAAIDSLAALLWDSYSRRAGIPEQSSGAGGGSGGGGAGASGMDPAQRGLLAATSLWQQWRSDAEASAPNDYAPIALDAIGRRHDGRASLSDGYIQAFAAQQVGAAELMAYVVTAERPSRAAHSKDIMQQMSTARRGAAHIFTQLAATERAMLELWMLRLSEDGK